jgi:multiple sugar transport system substrate-binding protein
MIIIIITTIFRRIIMKFTKRISRRAPVALLIALSVLMLVACQGAQPSNPGETSGQVQTPAGSADSGQQTSPGETGNTQNYSYLTDFGFYPLAGDPLSAPAASISGGGDVTLEIWMTPHWNISDPEIHQGGDYGLEEFLLETLHRFAASYEGANITEVRVENMPGADRDERISVAMATDTLPDMLFESFFSVGPRAHEGLYVDITDIISPEARADIPSGIWDAVTIGDRVFCYPFVQGLLFWGYNADMFRDAGLDNFIAGKNEVAVWSDAEYLEILNALKENLPPEVYPMTFFCLNNQVDAINLAWMRMFGAEWFDRDGFVVANNPLAVRGLQYMVDIKNAGLSNPNPESIQGADTLDIFFNQRTAMNFMQNVHVSRLLNNFDSGEVEEFDMRIATIPGTHPRTISYVHGFMVFDTANPTSIAVAKDFVSWVAGDRNLMAESRWMLPVSDTIASYYSDFDPFMDAYIDAMSFLFDFSNNSVSYGELRNALFPELQAAFTGAKTPQQALDDYTDRANRIIEEGLRFSVLAN